MAGKVEVEVIPVEGIGVRTEDGGELTARTCVHGAQKRPIARFTVPALLDRDSPAVGKDEA